MNGDEYDAADMNDAEEADLAAMKARASGRSLPRAPPVLRRCATGMCYPASWFAWYALQDSNLQPSEPKSEGGRSATSCPEGVQHTRA